jgi:hypothetical protein
MTRSAGANGTIHLTRTSSHIHTPLHISFITFNPQGTTSIWLDSKQDNELPFLVANMMDMLAQSSRSTTSNTRSKLTKLASAGSHVHTVPLSMKTHQHCHVTKTGTRQDYYLLPFHPSLECLHPISLICLIPPIPNDPRNLVIARM